MPFLLGTEKVTIEMPSKTVLSDISLGVDTGNRIGIVGRNGDGKSTLLNVLAGAVEPDAGRVIVTSGTTVGVLSQQDQLNDEHTVRQAVVGQQAEYEWASNPRIRSLFQNLLEDIPWDAAIKTLSGGQRRRVDLARVLAGDWDVLMLDEPTNHLDVRAINWLAGHLKTRWRANAGALLVVTHDRWFLDEVCNTMWEVHAGKVLPFEGGFSAYVMQRVERNRQAAVAEQKRQNALRRELAWLSRGARARATKPKFHVAAARALIEDVPELRNQLELKRMAMARIGKQVVDLLDVQLSYDNNAPTVEIPEWHIGPGDRIGIVGANGAGKTTLLNLIQGTLRPTKGRVKIGSTVRFAVLSQHLDNLKPFEDERVRQAVSRFPHRLMLDGKEQTSTQLLEQLGFDSADLNEFVRDLSGGQRRRLALMMILLEEPNVLILDEPGNDLDIDMLAAVEELLDGWPGTLVMVSHDRYLLERVTDMQYALVDGRLRHLPRGVAEYLDEAANGTPAATPAPAAPEVPAAAADEAPATVGAPAPAPQEGGQTLSHAERHHLKKQVASLERKMETAQTRLDAAQDALQAVNPTDYQALSQAQAEIDELGHALSQLEEAWLEASEKLEL